MRIALIAGGMLFVSAIVSAGQDIQTFLNSQVGTLSAVVTPQTVGGHLSGCTVVFATFIRDWTYRGGGYSKVDGSFGFMRGGGNNLGISLKVVVNDVVELNPMKMQPAAPASIYFLSADGLTSTRTQQAATIESDTPGGRMVVYPLSLNEMVLDAIGQNRITIAFARKSGGADVHVPIDLTVTDFKPTGERVRDPGNMSRMFNCIQALVSSTLK